MKSPAVWGALLLFGLVFIALSFGLTHFGGVQARRADLVAAPPGDGAFREELVVSPGPLLTSRHGRNACVTYRTRVILHSEWTDESSDEIVFEEDRGPATLELTREDGQTVRLPRELWRDPYLPSVETRREPPEWLSPVPERRAPKTEFRVEETCLEPGQRVFVAATLGPMGQLSVDPELKMAVVYPGSRQDCVQYYRSESAVQRQMGQVFLVVGGLVALFSVGMLLRLRK